MLSASWEVGALVLLLGILVYERISIHEEEYLRATFGPTHAARAADVPARLPRTHGWVKPERPFWFRRMFWCENKKVFWLATAILLFDLARRASIAARCRTI